MKEKLIINKKQTSAMFRIRGVILKLFRVTNLSDKTFIDLANRDLVGGYKNKEMYAKLINNKWYWVSDCRKYNNQLTGKTYIECKKHSVCNECGISREKTVDNVWSITDVWVCRKCWERKQNKKLK